MATISTIQTEPKYSYTAVSGYVGGTTMVVDQNLAIQVPKVQTDLIGAYASIASVHADLSSVNAEQLQTASSLSSLAADVSSAVSALQSTDAELAEAVETLEANTSGFAYGSVPASTAVPGQVHHQWVDRGMGDRANYPLDSAHEPVYRIRVGLPNGRYRMIPAVYVSSSMPYDSLIGDLWINGSVVKIKVSDSNLDSAWVVIS